MEILKMILCPIVSQCSCFSCLRIGVVWLNFLESVTSLAAAFCNCWSRFDCILMRLWSSELHVSSTEVMSVWVNRSATSCLICFRIIPIFLIDTHTALGTFTMRSVGVICVLTFDLFFIQTQWILFFHYSTPGISATFTDVVNQNRLPFALLRH